MEIVFQLRQLALAEREDVGDDAERRARRVDVGPARDVLLEDVVLDRAGERRQRNALPSRDGDVEREQDDRRRVDRHRRRDAIERDAVEELGHVLDRIDRDADAADFSGGQRVVGVVAHLRRQVEGDAQAADALREEVTVSLVRLGGGPETAYCRIVHSRPRYIVGWMPRVYGKSPGNPRSSSGSQSASDCRIGVVNGHAP